ncbi:helix-turn-helix transcriptional regulator [Streptomyces sp. NPDC001139]
MAKGVQGLWEREAECAGIANALKAATQGRGGMLLVQGPAGIGKTRLLAETRTQAAEAGARTAAARASELERDFAFGVVRQLFEPLLTGPEPTDRDGLWAGPAAQARPVFQGADQPAGPAGNFAVLHGLYWLTANACQHDPLLLVVDDLQWSDAPSLRFLTYLLPHLDDLNLLLACALRTGERTTDETLLDQLTTDPAVQVLHPHPLSEHAGTRLLAQTTAHPVDQAFATACHHATDGNPLLLHALARTLADQHLAPVAANADRIAEIGPRAVGRLTAARMARLPETARTLAQAVAVLGDRADLAAAAALAGQDTTSALEGAAELDQLEILRVWGGHAAPRLSFAHPLIRAAVYDTLGHAERARWHQRAAYLMAAAPGADPEHTAAHLLHAPSAGDPQAVAWLRDAAAQAYSRGSPQSAVTYLRRCLAEPPTEAELPDLLEYTGHVALEANTEDAAGYLQRAYDLITAPERRARLAIPLGISYLYAMSPDRAAQVWTEALAEAAGLPSAAEGTRRRLHAALLNLGFMVPGRGDLLPRLPQRVGLPRHDSVGGRMLDCAIATDRMSVCDPSALAYARAGLADGLLIRQALGESAIASGWMALLVADDELAVESLDTAVQQAHSSGSLRALTQSLAFRALGRLWRGQLSDAETDARESQRVGELGHQPINRLFGWAYLAEAKLEQGRLEETEEILAEVDRIPGMGLPLPAYFPLDCRARLLRARGDHPGALDAALLAGESWGAFRLNNPGMAGWRSTAALSLHALGRDSEARAMAAEELVLARRWGAPRALGRALRVSGLVTRSEQGLGLLREAVAVLKDSPARLEHAKALADLGAALRRSGHRADARGSLREAVDLATRCGAAPVAENARAELAAAGGRPQRTALTGPDALTPSERRVAELAASGATNRQIAQQLYVTPKTVEVHLSAVYRKLDITTRTHLAPALTPGPSRA